MDEKKNIKKEIKVGNDLMSGICGHLFVGCPVSLSLPAFTLSTVVCSMLSVL